MKLSLSWLAEWIDHRLEADALARQLTMLGLEVDAVLPVAAPVARLVVGRVLEVRPHPNAERLSLCRVDVGTGEPLGIVCGARNVRAGGLYATALEGARLPGGMVIKAARIRGEASAGMLCAAAELGLDSPADGLLELDPDAVPGADASSILGLGDAVLDINVTPNRADCFSVVGIARDLAAATGAVAREPDGSVVAPRHDAEIPVQVGDPADCPRFLGRILRGVQAGARTPLWMQERLRRGGIRPINAVVDVTNYVMLELGQPLHAYDLGKLRGGIRVRRAAPGESLRLLDGQAVTADESVLVIADEGGAVGLAGIMGGSGTAVTTETREIFLECAWFAPAVVAGRARRYGLHTDAAVRFERGVDPALQDVAMERATALILAIAGGEPGPVSRAQAPRQLPARKSISLRARRLARVLGTDVPAGDVAAILGRLRMNVATDAGGWLVTPPTARFDIEIEEDLIEEVARIFGYERIAPVTGRGQLQPARTGEAPGALDELTATLVARGYQEAITYSFVDADAQRLFGFADSAQLALSNPISADLAVMRQSLWPGLVRAVRENLRRQQSRVRLFEAGTRFLAGPGQATGEERCLAGVAVGARRPEQWGQRAAAVDFYDVKADVEALLRLAGLGGLAQFQPAVHPALHPGRAAQIVADGRPLGWIGEIHPALAARLDVQGAMLFELSADALVRRRTPVFRPPSVFPSVRRDIAVVVSRDVTAAALLAAIRAAATASLREAFVFDIYTGQQVGEREKSVAIGLILQDTSRTLTDEDVNRVVSAVTAALGREFQARIRE